MTSPSAQFPARHRIATATLAVAAFPALACVFFGIGAVTANTSSGATGQPAAVLSLIALCLTIGLAALGIALCNRDRARTSNTTSQ
ncbi:hypothetical protein [Streptomyces sp. NPDC059009]|uniref:hypothetical protein n=1 Tax=Streptomyces sp. NPDC059009 TaxID=3346694 RepID=UPI003695C5F4